MGEEELHLGDIEIEDGEPTDKGLLEIGKYVADSIADNIKRISRAPQHQHDKLRGIEDIKEVGAKIKISVADQTIKDTIDDLTEKGVGSVRVYSEERGITSSGKDERGIFMVLSPLDCGSGRWLGYSNPDVAVSVALGKCSDLPGTDSFESIRAGVVKNAFNPWSFYAVSVDDYDGKGNSSFCYDSHSMRERGISVHPISCIGGSRLVIDYDSGEGGEKEHIARHEALSDIRARVDWFKTDSNTSDLCGVASRSYDGFIGFGGRIKFQDIAAVKFVIERAGGVFKTHLAAGYGGNLLELLSQSSPEEAQRSLGETRFNVIATSTAELNKKIEDHARGYLTRYSAE
ncbi:hypothetical protein ACFLZ6_00180 [Nanoarchaeota archaeon]